MGQLNYFNVMLYLAPKFRSNFSLAILFLDKNGMILYILSCEIKHTYCE